MAEGLYIVDGSGFVFRAFHALPPLTTRAGLPAGAVFGFCGMLIKLEMDYQPSHLVVVFDAATRSFRDELFAAYKAQRKAPPQELVPQFGMVKKAVAAFGITQLAVDGVEADDVIATLVKIARGEGMPVTIVSSDKDLMQLVDDAAPRVTMLDTVKERLYDIAGVKEKLGVPPPEVADLLSLMGDSVDNIPGIPGVGPKTAAALISHFGSLGAIYARLDEVPTVSGLRGGKSVLEKLRLHESDVHLSRKLVALDDAVPLPSSKAPLHGKALLDTLVRAELDVPRVEQMLGELDFARLIDRLRGARRVAQAAVAVEKTARPAITPAGKMSGRVPEILRDANALAGFVEAAGKNTVGVSVAPGVIGIGLATAERSAYVPFSHRYLGAGVQLLFEAARPGLARIFGADVPKHVLGSKDAEVLLGRVGLKLEGVVGDPLLCAYLLDAGDHSLDELVATHLQSTLAARESLTGSGKRALGFDEVEIERAAAVVAAEAEASLLVGAALADAVRFGGHARLLDEVELPLAHVLAEMEAVGIRLDIPRLQELGSRVQHRMEGLETEVRQIAGRDINLGSPKQLQELLFDQLRLPPSKKTKTGWSVDAEVLEELAPLHPVAERIAEHRTLAKLKGTYIDALPSLVDKKTGRLTTNYRQTSAATGRLSSAEPNLQNIPIHSELGKEIRDAFRAQPGWLLIAGDYSQIELRVLAHMSKDPVLVDAFSRNEDIHRRTVVEMFGAERADDVGLRRVAKMINYGIIYGLSDYGLSQRLGIERDEARRYIDGYLRTYKGLAAYVDGLIEIAYREGGSRTMLGRFRPLPELASKSRQVRMAGERMARNTPVQGTAADVLKLAMVDVAQALAGSGTGARMLLTVHDELVVETPADRAEEVKEILGVAMRLEKTLPLDVPLKVDLGVGETWAKAK
jgi:DNA polymerase-1